LDRCATVRTPIPAGSGGISLRSPKKSERHCSVSTAVAVSIVLMARSSLRTPAVASQVSVS
jgi:hypothetical protein